MKRYMLHVCTLALALLCAWPRTLPAAEKAKESRDAEIEKYRAIVDEHRANEKRASDALRRLGKYYEESGRVEEGLRYFLGMIDEVESRGREGALKDIFGRYRIKHPQLVEEGVLKALPEETNAYTRKQEFRVLRNVATDRSRKYLMSVADSELENDEFRKMAREILARLDT